MRANENVRLGEGRRSVSWLMKRAAAGGVVLISPCRSMKTPWRLGERRTNTLRSVGSGMAFRKLLSACRVLAQRCVRRAMPGEGSSLLIPTLADLLPIPSVVVIFSRAAVERARARQCTSNASIGSRSVSLHLLYRVTCARLAAAFAAETT